ncbi:hypothetical protein THIX_60383 [Thiomonas sp. X19]|nr:hypothetical protein THIX_60383 [Thiomonas sp. X19]
MPTMTEGLPEHDKSVISRNLVILKGGQVFRQIGVGIAHRSKLPRRFSAILRKCEHDWEWLDKAAKIRMLKEPIRRIRFLTRDAAQRLLAELPACLADMLL